jgi:hypothetical protein
MSTDVSEDHATPRICQARKKLEAYSKKLYPGSKQALEFHIYEEVRT